MFSNVKLFGKKISEKAVFKILGIILILAVLVSGSLWVKRIIEKEVVLRKIINNLTEEPHEAEILIKSNTLEEKTGKIKTTIRFQEQNNNIPNLKSQAFTFEGNTLKVATISVSLKETENGLTKNLEGKKLNLFLKIIALESGETKEFKLLEPGTIPLGYQIYEPANPIEIQFWDEIWSEILDKDGNVEGKIKETLIPVSASYFLPGTRFQLRLAPAGKLQIETRHPSYYEKVDSD